MDSSETSRLRSAGESLFLLPFLLLPYRWLWLPCGLAAAMLVRPGTQSVREIVARDGTLIVGSMIVLLLRTFFDLTWWLPSIGVLAGLLLLRGSRAWRPGLGYALAPAAMIAAFLLLLRPDAYMVSTRNEHSVPKDLTIVCAGDSLTSGVKPGTDEGTYVASLRDRFGCTVVNAGVANDRTADLLARLDRTVLSHHPDVVLLFIGGNDFLDGTPRSQFAEHLDAIAGRISAFGAKLVIVEVPSGIIWNRFAGVYRQVARRYNAVLVPETPLRLWYSIELLVRDRLSEPLTIDGIHLSPAGAARVADWLAPYLARAG
jgi:lysophospholipase L1-like esterase